MTFLRPQEALEAGIATIHQELACFDHLTVAENLLLGEKWPRYRWGGVDWGRVYESAGEKLKQFEVGGIAPESFFLELSTAQRQEVAMVRALSRKATLLILDEPSASLSEPEVKRLFGHLGRLRQSGVSILYVSHRLDEIMLLTDRVAVLRDGELVATYSTAKATLPGLVRDMVGRPLDQVYPRTRRGRAGAPLLELNGVTRRGMFRAVSFTLHAGEIVGLAGLVGAGRSELARAIFGMYSVDAGSMRLGGGDWAPKQARAAVAAGLVYVPEERKHQGFVLDHSLGDSISIGFSDLLTCWGRIDALEEGQRVGEARAKFGIRAQNDAQAIGTLSGGNRQKALLARWLERGREVILLDEPTRGVDVGAKAEIHQLIDRLAGEGKGVLLISSDLPEVLGMSDRILVMEHGTISTELTGAAMPQENVLLAASGLYRGHRP